MDQNKSTVYIKIRNVVRAHLSVWHLEGRSAPLVRGKSQNLWNEAPDPAHSSHTTLSTPDTHVSFCIIKWG